MFSDIVQLVVVISALIILHEIGHFLGARMFKIDVEEFGIGIPPSMFRYWRAKGGFKIGNISISVPAGRKLLKDLEKGTWVNIIAKQGEGGKNYVLQDIQIIDPTLQDVSFKQETTQDGLTRIQGEVTATHLGMVYSLNWLPLGGFVRIKGEGDPSISDGLAAVNPWKRLVVYFMGPLMNLLLGVILYAIIISQIGLPDTNKVIVVEVSPNSPAEEAGLLPEDLIEEINDIAVDSTTTLRNTIYDNLGQSIDLVVNRDGEIKYFSMVPRENPPEGEGAIGIIMGNPTESISWIQAIPMGAVSTATHAVSVFTIPAEVVRGAITPQEARPVGYKGMYDIYQDVQERELVPGAPESFNVIWFFTTITISLGVLNLLPIPALDGGRILFVLPEIIFRRRIPVGIQNVVNMVSFTIMILLFFYINYLDFVNPVQLP